MDVQVLGKSLPHGNQKCSCCPEARTGGDGHWIDRIPAGEFVSPINFGPSLGR